MEIMFFIPELQNQRRTDPSVCLEVMINGKRMSVQERMDEHTAEGL